MKKIEKEILDIINPTAQEVYEHKFTSLKDTCSNPNPPYTMRITPLYHFFTHHYQIMAQVSMYDDDEVEIFTEAQMDYLIKNSPLHYMYPGAKESVYDADINHSILLIAIDNFENIKLTDNQFKYLIQNSDLNVGKKEGVTPLIFALSKYQADVFHLNEENWDLLKQSARSLDFEYVNSLEKRFDLQDNYFIMYPQLAKQLKDIIKEQHIIANKEELESTLVSHKSKKSSLKL